MDVYMNSRKGDMTNRKKDAIIFLSPAPAGSSQEITGKKEQKMEWQETKGMADAIQANVEKVMVGKSKTIELVLAALLAQGHVQLEDVPGTGKTMLAKALALSLGTEFKRI